VIKRRQEIHWSTLNAHSAHRKATLYFTSATAATLASLVTDIVTDVLTLSADVDKSRYKGPDAEVD